MKKLFWLLRSIFKARLCRVALIIEYCHTCGREQPLVWLASDGLWNWLMPHGGLLCPECFDRVARKAGIALRWTPTVEYRFAGTPLPQVTVADAPCCDCFWGTYACTGMRSGGYNHDSSCRHFNPLREGRHIANVHNYNARRESEKP